MPTKRSRYIKELPSLALDHPVARYLHRLGPGSHRSVMHALRILSQQLDPSTDDPTAVRWETITADQCVRISAFLRASYGPMTVRRILQVLRSIIKEATPGGELRSEVAAAVDTIKPKRSRPAMRSTTRAELDRLFVSCHADHSVAGCRDAAALALLYAAGLRRSAAVSLDCQDYLPSGMLRMPDELAQPERFIHLSRSARAAIDAWLCLRGAEPGPLVCPVDKAGRVHIRRMTDQALYILIVRRSRKAGVQVAPDALRRPYWRRLATRRRTARSRQGTVTRHCFENGESRLKLRIPFRGCDIRRKS